MCVVLQLCVIQKCVNAHTLAQSVNGNEQLCFGDLVTTRE